MDEKIGAIEYDNTREWSGFSKGVRPIDRDLVIDKSASQRKRITNWPLR